MSNKKKIVKILIVSGLVLSSVFLSFADMPNKTEDILDTKSKVHNNKITKEYKIHKQYNANNNTIFLIKTDNNKNNDNILLNTVDQNSYQINKIENYEAKLSTKFNTKTLEMIDKDLAQKYANQEINKEEIIEKIKEIMSI